MSLAPVITRPELLSRLAALIDGAQSGCPDRIAIDGRDAAGKTTLADELAGLLSKQRRRVIRASVDGFHRTRELRHRQGRGSPEGYYRDAFDYAALRAELLEPLGPRGSRVYRTAVFDPATDSAIEQEPALAPDDAVLLVDGVFLLRPELRDAWDIRIYVSVTQEESLRRALRRDVALFGSEVETERLYRERYLPGQQIYHAEARPEETAHAVVVNDDPDRPRLTLTPSRPGGGVPGRSNPK